MKLNDRVRVVTNGDIACSWLGTLLAIPEKDSTGLVWLDEENGHRGGGWDVGEIVRGMIPQNVDIAQVERFFDTEKRCFWFVKPGDFIVIEEEEKCTKKMTGHIPGVHNCSMGCGMTNDHADASAFVTGKYVCFQCSLWARKCEW